MLFGLFSGIMLCALINICIADLIPLLVDEEF